MNVWQTIGIVVLTAVLTWIGHVVLAGQQRKLDVAKALEEHKRAVYGRFLKLFFENLKSAKEESARKAPPKHDKLAVEIMDITKDMMVYASDDVLGLFVKFRAMALDEQRDPKDLVEWFGKIIVQMRKDLGYRTTKVGHRDVLHLLITDIEKLYPGQHQ